MNAIHVLPPRPSGTCPACGQYPADCECSPHPPRRVVVEFEPVRLPRTGRITWRGVAAATIATAVAVVIAATVGRAAPKPCPTLFPAVLRPADAAPWMRAPAGIPQPSWIR